MGEPVKVTLRMVPSAEPTPDAVALRGVAGGDIGALGVVFDRHAAAVLRFAIRIAGSADAEDVVQATFLRAAAVAGKFDGRAPSAKAWLFGIAANIVQERRRGFARLTRALLRFGELGKTAVGPVADERSDLERALDRLSPPKRVAIILAEVEGYSCEEIPSMVGVPLGTVCTRLHHARKELRAYLEEVE